MSNRVQGVQGLKIEPDWKKGSPQVRGTIFLIRRGFLNGAGAAPSAMRCVEKFVRLQRGNWSVDYAIAAHHFDLV